MNFIRIISLIFISFSVVNCDSPASLLEDGAPEDFDASLGSQSAGAALYVSSTLCDGCQSCESCHGLSGNGTTNITGSNLEAAAQKIRNGGFPGPNPMPAYSQEVLTTDEVNDVLAYLQSIGIN